MSKIIDVSPISVTRIRRSTCLHVYLDSAGAVTQVEASRVTATQKAGVDQTTPVDAAVITLAAAAISSTIKTQLVALAAAVDTADTAP